MLKKDMLPEIWKNKWKILEGLKNRTFKKEHIEQLAEYRHSVCERCIWNSANQKGKEFKDIPDIIKNSKPEKSLKETINDSTNRCLSCGCNIQLKDSMKLRCLSCECPKKKWLAVVNETDIENDILKLTKL